jgi:hypothetical protein
MAGCHVEFASINSVNKKTERFTIRALSVIRRSTLSSIIDILS